MIPMSEMEKEHLQALYFNVNITVYYRRYALHPSRVGCFFHFSDKRSPFFFNINNMELKLWDIINFYLITI